MSIRFIIENMYDRCDDLDATSKALPVAYTQSPVRGRVWRSVDTAQQLISGSLSSVGNADGFVLGRHNLSSAGTIQLVLKLSGSVVYDSGIKTVEQIVPAGVWRAGVDPFGATYNDKINPQVGSIWFSAVAFDEFEITINDPVNPDQYIQVSRIFLGLSFRPSVGNSRGAKLDWVEKGKHQRTEGGSIRTDGGSGAYRRLSINLDWFNGADRTAYQGYFYSAGKGSDFYVSCYPEEGGMKEIEYSFIAKRDSDLSLTNNLPNNWQAALVAVET